MIVLCPARLMRFLLPFPMLMFRPPLQISLFRLLYARVASSVQVLSLHPLSLSLC